MAYSDPSTAVDHFIWGLATLPTYASMDNLLRKAFTAEEEIRQLFAVNPHSHVLQNLLLGLVDVFGINPALRRTRAREIVTECDLTRDYIFPVDASFRRPNLMPSTVPDINIFRENWELFTHGTLSKMTAHDWENVIAAGGSVLACLSPPQPSIPAKTLNDLYQSKTYATSDIDLFLWGLSPEQAKFKMERVYQAVCEAAPWNVTCVRKAHRRILAVPSKSFSDFINPQLKFWLDLMSTLHAAPSMDVVESTLTKAGKNVWVNPRSLGAIIRQANTIDMARRSPSYELRLAKYAERHYEIYLPSLNRPQVDPLVFAPRLQAWPQGLARLLALERSYYDPHHYLFLTYPERRVLKKAPKSKIRNLRSKSNAAPPLITSDYDYSLGQAQIPYGPLWDAAAIAEMISKTPILLAWYEDSQQPHKHIFFAGDMQQCLGTFCSECADQGGEGFDRDVYIRGHAQFLVKNPDPQLATASFRPIEIGDWEGKAYARPN
ncbi:hypothetical protein CVT26_008111 [Gymnopilus dilepis]|uniref:Uncharacterized protein n=1 Tax=Gymnopilus dilepis TaxID=231916 RepID=A0A409YJU4_9AGAR|nr:hypothetical protein CVT26_008111 [Gymnopilus dilepis]